MFFFCSICCFGHSPSRFSFSLCVLMSRPQSFEVWPNASFEFDEILAAIRYRSPAIFGIVHAPSWSPSSSSSASSASSSSVAGGKVNGTNSALIRSPTSASASASHPTGPLPLRTVCDDDDNRTVALFDAHALAQALAADEHALHRWDSVRAFGAFFEELLGTTYRSISAIRCGFYERRRKN
jgi:hypothetical protein